MLTDRKVQTAKPQEKPYRLFDTGGVPGLALLVQPSGVKSWQLRYRLHGKAQTLTIGKLANVSLEEARNRARDARKKAEDGVHLTLDKRATKSSKRAAAERTFKVLADEWVARQARRQQWSDAHRKQVEASIRNHLSKLYPTPVGQINAKLAAPVLAAVDRQAPLMYEKVRPRLHAILDYATEMGDIPGNPLPVMRRDRRKDRRHYPAITDLAQVGEVLRNARGADPCKGIQRAHALLVFTAQRVSEVVGAHWSEFELDGVEVPTGERHRKRMDNSAGNWRIPRERMKRKDAERGPHVIPLPPALLAALREWKKADGDDAKLVCPAPRDSSKPITPEAVEKHYREVLGLSGKHSPHSWRSAFKTICSDAGKPRDLSEAQLDHVIGDKTESAYDRAARVELRRELMTWYECALISVRDRAS